MSVETVCRCQMSYRWVMVTSLRAMGNIRGLQGRQREDCLLIKRAIESVCVCACVRKTQTDNSVRFLTVDRDFVSCVKQMSH